MDIKPVAPRSDDKSVSALEKKPYVRPVLRVYGTVSALTSAKNLSTVDGQTMRVSDRIVKENINKIGDHPLGIGVYLFDYKTEYREKYGHGRQIGVMADEVESVMPEAVSIHPDGFKLVNYAMLGITKAMH
jgi:Chaperone of endosialidase